MWKPKREGGAWGAAPILRQEMSDYLVQVQKLVYLCLFCCVWTWSGFDFSCNCLSTIDWCVHVQYKYHGQICLIHAADVKSVDISCLRPGYDLRSMPQQLSTVSSPVINTAVSGIYWEESATPFLNECVISKWDVPFIRSDGSFPRYRLDRS